MSGLRCLEKLLKRKQFRERFAAVCVEPQGAADGHHLAFASFSHKLGGLRWQVVTEFCRAAASLYFSVVISRAECESSVVLIQGAQRHRVSVLSHFFSRKETCASEL